jgi:hypothetical protein
MAIGSMGRIKTTKEYGWVLIWSIDEWADGWAAASLIQRSERKRAQGGTTAGGMGELKLKLRGMKRSKVSSYVI